MNLQNLIPQQAQPISRITTGQLPTELTELTEEVLGEAVSSSSGSSSILPGIAPDTSVQSFVCGPNNPQCDAVFNTSRFAPGDMMMSLIQMKVDAYEKAGLCSYDGDDAE
jgi:bacteriocin leader peptide (microcyclamide/patellamide family)